MTMKAIFYDQYGPPEVLQLREVPAPAPKEDEVLLKVHAAALNSWDWDLLRGEPRIYRLMFGLQKPKIKILGADIAGTVMAVGAKVKQFRPGDEVFGDISAGSWGGFAEYVCARENAVVPKPAGMSFEQAAALSQAGVMALQGLRYRGGIERGQKVLINGAGGGVGTFAVQLAKLEGAEVTAVDSAEKLDMLRAMGADHVIDYKKEDFTARHNCYDLVLDVVAHRSVFEYKRALRPGGTFVMIGGLPGRILQVAAVGPFISSAKGRKTGLLAYQPNQKDQNFLAGLIEAGKLKAVIDKVYPLREVPEAIRRLGEGHALGKVVIRVLD